VIIFTSPHWTEEGVCMKHLVAQTPCPTCIELYDNDIEVSIDQFGKDLLLFGYIDEYLEAQIKDIIEFRYRQILFRKF
jgi:hypothetical protein